MSSRGWAKGKKACSRVSGPKTHLDIGTRMPKETQVLGEPLKTRTVEKGRQETLFKAMSHSLMKDRERSKENETCENDGGGHWKSKSKKPKSTTDEEYISQPWLCKETDPFTLMIRNFEFPKRICMPSNVKMYDVSGDPEDHLRKFQTAAKAE
ncbi:hypothetical protein Tco_0878193 [Tanacetum coccineum]|uniref:Reverse transcriptase domain-containing protein n=1 Tax=Tanacetum coccineum TaxID=301880 RepID=A0ABQ5C082_9ASTR